MSQVTFNSFIWQKADDPAALLSVLPEPVSARKLRFLIVAVARRIWGRCNDLERATLDVLERYIDGLAAVAAVEACRSRLRDQPSEYPGVFDRVVRCTTDTEHTPLVNARHAIQTVLNYASNVLGQYVQHGYGAQGREEAGLELKRLAAVLVRDIFGNPGEPVAVDAAWLRLNGGTALALAQAIDDERAFDRLPILADALEDAGCCNEQILQHCREPGEHCHGCWLMDRLLDHT